MNQADRPTTTAAVPLIVPPLWRRFARRARAVAEQTLHEGRRQRALSRLRVLSATRSVLFVCEGNIYRSPFAASCFAAQISTRWPVSLRVGSAGFVGADRSSPIDARKAAAQRGIDLVGHRSKVLSHSVGAEWDLIFVMEARQARLLTLEFAVPAERIVVLGDLDSEPIERRTIVDPWPAPAELVERSYTRIERCVRVLAEVAISSWPAAAVEADGQSPSS
jgi:protein-tyrosine phosphatase